jgi:hypothetical protein
MVRELKAKESQIKWGIQRNQKKETKIKEKQDQMTYLAY